MAIIYFIASSFISQVRAVGGGNCVVNYASENDLITLFKFYFHLCCDELCFWKWFN